MTSEFYPPRKKDRPPPPRFHFLRTAVRMAYRWLRGLSADTGRMLWRVVKAAPLAFVPGYYYFHDKKYPHGYIVLAGCFILLAVAVHQAATGRSDVLLHIAFFIHSLLSYQALFNCLNRGVARKHRVPLFVVFLFSVGLVGAVYYYLWWWLGH